MANIVDHSFLLSNQPAKRKFLTVEQESGVSNSDVELCLTKRQKEMHTGKYIYKTLFEESQDSDVKITALSRTWNLHRLYLSQSPYLNSMLNDIWDKTTQKGINIEIKDDNITTEALHKVFGSLYDDEIHIEPLEAVSILATASLLQLDNLIIKSSEIMKHNIDIDTVLSYYEASKMYGLRELKYSTMEWLKKDNLLCMLTSPSYLQQISCELMVEFVSSPQFLNVPSEFGLYRVLKQWLFVKVNTDFRDYKKLIKATDDYFKAKSGNLPFLSTNIGSPYQNAFRALRLKDLVIHDVHMEIIEADHIIPVDWFMPIIEKMRVGCIDDEEATRGVEASGSILRHSSTATVSCGFTVDHQTLMQDSLSYLKHTADLAEQVLIMQQQVAENAIKVAADAKTQAEAARKIANERGLAEQGSALLAPESVLPGIDASYRQYLQDSLNRIKNIPHFLEQVAVNRQQTAEKAIQAVVDSKIAVDMIRKTLNDRLKDS